MPEMQSVDGKKVMIVRGIGGRDVLADTLKSRGAAVSFAECYQRINPQSSCEALSTLWAADQLDGIVVTSSEAMRYLLDLANNTTWLSQVTLYVNHARIAELPLSMGLHVNIAHAPGDEAMMELICNVSARPF
jgi:uroporphyrinogen-III synthase